jgi:hypothetical protein
LDESGEPTCTLESSPPNCSPVCQHSDMYFYREVRGRIVKFQTCPLLTAAKCELSNSEHCIKRHELIPNQWQEPIHSNTIKYAWCVAKLITSHEVFSSINQDVFLDEVKTAKYECSK